MSSTGWPTSTAVDIDVHSTPSEAVGPFYRVSMSEEVKCPKFSNI